jgi:transposase
MTRVDQLQELVRFGFRDSTIATWSDDRIATVLSARRRDARLATQQANRVANEIEGATRGQPSRVERLAAAAALEEELPRGGDALVNAVLYVGHCLTDDEARELAENLIGKFRSET